MKDKLKVLFATDFSPASRIASQLLKSLQQSYTISLSLIHVIPSFWKDWFASQTYKREASQRLQTWQIDLTAKKDLKKLDVQYGNPADMILQKAQTAKANLIVLGGKVISATGRYKTGTTVEAVARHAKQSILVCKNDNISRILCGVDTSRSSAKALRFAIDLSHRFSASLCIIHVIPYGDVNPLGLNEQEERELIERFKVEQVDKLENFLANFDFSNIIIKKCYPFGIPANNILDMAEDFKYDLIIVGAKGHSILHHVFIGSTSEKILRYAPCSLLIVR